MVYSLSLTSAYCITSRSRIVCITHPPTPIKYRFIIIITTMCFYVAVPVREITLGRRAAKFFLSLSTTRVLNARFRLVDNWTRILYIK